eukprot:3940253-Rhodomonas_salina.1
MLLRARLYAATRCPLSAYASYAPSYSRLRRINALFRTTCTSPRCIALDSGGCFFFQSEDHLASVALVVNGCFVLHNLINKPYKNPLHQAPGPSMP